MARPQVEITFNDNGLEGLFARVKAANPDAGVDIGVIDPDDNETALVAAVHEMGSPEANIPARAPFRRTMEANKSKYNAITAQAFKQWLDGKMSLDQAMLAVGIEIRSDVQKAIMKGLPPPLQEATVKAKQRLGLPRAKTALYATGKFFEAIKVRLTGSKERGA